MSVQALKAALAKASPQPTRVIVSDVLFYELLVAKELAPQHKKLTLPTDPNHKASIEKWLISEGVPTDPTLTSWHLSHHNGLEVVPDSYLETSLNLSDSGPGSFVLK